MGREPAFTRRSLRAILRYQIGCTATRAAMRHLKNEPLPEKIMLPAEIIDKTNYKAWLTPIDQRVCPAWADIVR